MRGAWAFRIRYDESNTAVTNSSVDVRVRKVYTRPTAQVSIEEADRAMARYAEGDDESFELVFAAVAPTIQRFLRRLSGDDEIARDLLQETLIRMHQARGSFRPGSAVLPWSYAIARNVFVDSARARRRVPVPMSALSPHRTTEPATPGEAESNLLAREAARAVERALAALTDARREAFVLLRFEGLSVADAAEILGTTQNAVKLRAFQAYEAIRAELERSTRKSGSGRAGTKS